jgi:alpha-D-ribose 1-methylphosphonate 5-triphosphate synthase subunit PhnG
MLQSVDGLKDMERRRHWIGVLARAELAFLEQEIRKLEPPAHVWLRRPETGLTMVRARIGGTGDKFNLGETTVTRCTLRLATGETGVAYIQGRSHRKVELAAIGDALLQSPRFHDAAYRTLVEPVVRELAARAARMQRQAQATRVEFFTVAREAGA